MRFGLAALFLGTLSMVTAHPSKENALRFEMYGREEDISAYGQAEGLHPEIPPGNQALVDSSAFNNGATTSEKVPFDINALALNTAPSIPGDQQWELDDISITDGTPTPPFDHPLDDTSALDVGGVPNSPRAGFTILQNKGSIPEDQGAGADDALGLNFTPRDPCNPFYQQNPRLRARDECIWKPDEPKKPDERSGTLPKKGAIPRSGTPLKVQLFPAGSKLYLGVDDDCWSSTLGLLPLGVCDSTEPFKIWFSLYAWETFRFFRLEDAQLGMVLFFPGNNSIKFLFYTTGIFPSGDLINSLQWVMDTVVVQVTNGAAIPTISKRAKQIYVRHSEF